MERKDVIVKTFAIAAIFFSLSSRAVDLPQIPATGRYVEVAESFGGKAGFGKDDERLIVQKRGAQIAILHQTSSFSLQYRFDLNNPGEQDFPENYLKIRRQNADPGEKSLANAIKRVTISDIAQGSSPDEITANANVYIHIPSVFVSNGFSAKVQIAGKFQVQKCSVRIMRLAGNVLESQIRPDSFCIDVEYGTENRLVQVTSNLGEFADKVIGIVFDVLLQVSARIGGEVSIAKES